MAGEADPPPRAGCQGCQRTSTEGQKITEPDTSPGFPERSLLKSVTNTTALKPTSAEESLATPAALHRCGRGSRVLTGCRYHIPWHCRPEMLSITTSSLCSQSQEQGKSESQRSNTWTPADCGVQLRGQALCGRGPPAGLGCFPTSSVCSRQQSSHCLEKSRVPRGCHCP